MRSGVRLGVDVGSVRIGLAASDPQGSLAFPVQTVARGRGDIATIVAAARERDAVEIVVGLPLTLRGSGGRAADAAHAFASELAAAVRPLPVRLVDERLSTVTAHAQLSDTGMRGSRARRNVVDQAAAVIILQGALDAERSTGTPPGEAVEVEL